MTCDRIHVVRLHVDCVVGVLAEERAREQTLEIDLDLHVDATVAGRSGKVQDTLDYDRVSREVETLLRFRRYRLLEMAGEEIAAMLLGVHPRLQAVDVRVIKPRALAGRAEAAGVSLHRQATDYERGRETSHFGEVEILFENVDAGLYLLHVDAGRRIAPHHHQEMRELEWLVDGEIERDGRPLTGFSPVIWPRARVHGYVNRGVRRATLFCCDSPPFLPGDEIAAQLGDGELGEGEGT